jgi:hypothetical protein
VFISGKAVERQFDRLQFWRRVDDCANGLAAATSDGVRIQLQVTLSETNTVERVLPDPPTSPP